MQNKQDQIYHLNKLGGNLLPRLQLRSDNHKIVVLSTPNNPLQVMLLKDKILFTPEACETSYLFICTAINKTFFRFQAHS